MVCFETQSLAAKRARKIFQFFFLTSKSRYYQPFVCKFLLFNVIDTLMIKHLNFLINPQFVSIIQGVSVYFAYYGYFPVARWNYFLVRGGIACSMVQYQSSTWHLLDIFYRH